MRSVKMTLAAGLTAALAIAMFASLALAGPPNAADFAWASSIQENKAAAFAWATSCHCGNCSNPDGLKWAEPKSTDPNRGKSIYLIKPSEDKIIGGWNLADELYRPFDGKAWGKPAKAPIELPKASTAEVTDLLAAVLVGLVAEDVDCPPGVQCNPPAVGRMPQTVMTGGSLPTTSFAQAEPAVFVEARRFGPVRRLVRAMRAGRAARSMAVQPATFSFVAAPMPTTFTQYASVPVETYKLEAVTENVPVTRYQYVPQSSKIAKPK